MDDKLSLNVYSCWNGPGHPVRLLRIVGLLKMSKTPDTPTSDVGGFIALGIFHVLVRQYRIFVTRCRIPTTIHCCFFRCT